MTFKPYLVYDANKDKLISQRDPVNFLQPPKVSLKIKKIDDKKFLVEAENKCHGLFCSFKILVDSDLKKRKKNCVGQEAFVGNFVFSESEEPDLDNIVLKSYILEHFQFFLLDKIFLLCSEICVKKITFNLKFDHLRLLNIFNNLSNEIIENIDSTGESYGVVFKTSGHSYDLLVESSLEYALKAKAVMWEEQKTNLEMRDYLKHVPLHTFWVD